MRIPEDRSTEPWEIEVGSGGGPRICEAADERPTHRPSSSLAALRIGLAGAAALIWSMQSQLGFSYDEWDFLLGGAAPA